MSADASLRHDSSVQTNTTHLTYLPDRATWLLWAPNTEHPGPMDPPAVAGPAGTPATVRLAIPEGARIVVRDMPGHEFGVTDGWNWLVARSGSAQDSSSVRAWTRYARLGPPAMGVDSPMATEDSDTTRTPPDLPTAAHCAITADGRHIHSADATCRRLTDALTALTMLDRAGLAARLRGYQLAGVQWLLEHDGGAILADDMGLGKTVQTLALMLRMPGAGHLVVCPTSVCANWKREIARHTPGLRLVSDRDEASPGTVAVTTYGRLRSSPDLFARSHRGVVAFDEAQQIKNPRTLSYRAAKSIPANYRVAITGTPVENDLGDLWALADLVRPGVLGTRSRFRDRYIVPIQNRGSASAADRLAAQTGDLVLRRTKSEVAPELPPRQVIDVTCSITPEQRRLYESAVAEAFDSGLGHGAARRTGILALLTKLKQICNHPAQALGSDGPLEGRSGKFDRVAEMLDEALATDTGCLVFTQYAAMGRLLTADLTNRTGVAVPFLHGGLRPTARERIVEDFQEGRGAGVLVLSLRAAGFGLNLTRATTVIHYDRWWNPAVEDQASDRAHRIGQDQPVTIYTLRSAGTVEDHIAATQTRKRGIADAALVGSDADLLHLTDDELRTVVQLSGEAAG